MLGKIAQRGGQAQVWCRRDQDAGLISCNNGSYIERHDRLTTASRLYCSVVKAFKIDLNLIVRDSYRKYETTLRST